MGHPLIDEFCRAHTLHPSFIHRCQREFREQIQPMLDEREQLLVRVAELEAQVAVEKRGPGRPRKEVAVGASA